MHRNYSWQSLYLWSSSLWLLLLLPLLCLGRRADVSPSTQIFLSQETIPWNLFLLDLFFCLQHFKHELSTQAFKPSHWPILTCFCSSADTSRFLQATRYTWWQIQECLYRFESLYMFWKHARWVLKQGKGESKALKKSKTGLFLLVVKLQWSLPLHESQRLIWGFCSSEFKLSAKRAAQGRR